MWSEVFLTNFLKSYLNTNKGMYYQEIIDMVNSIINAIPGSSVSDYDGARYFPEDAVKKELGLVYNELVESYANQGYGEMS